MPSSRCGIHSAEAEIGFQAVTSPALCELVVSYPCWTAEHHTAIHLLTHTLPPSTDNTRGKEELKQENLWVKLKIV